MLTSLALILLAGLAAASVCRALRLPPHGRNACRGNFARSARAEPAGRFDSRHFGRSAADGTCHHPDQGGAFASPRGFEAGGPSGPC